MHSQSVVELRSCTKIYVILDLETHFVCNFALIFLRDFTAMDSPLKLASRQQPRYFTTQNCFILLLLHVKCRQVFFLLKRMHKVLSSQNELTAYNQQTVSTHSQIPSFKHFRSP